MFIFIHKFKFLSLKIYQPGYPWFQNFLSLSLLLYFSIFNLGKQSDKSSLSFLWTMHWCFCLATWVSLRAHVWNGGKGFVCVKMSQVQMHELQRATGGGALWRDSPVNALMTFGARQLFGEGAVLCLGTPWGV